MSIYNFILPYFLFSRQRTIQRTKTIDGLKQSDDNEHTHTRAHNPSSDIKIKFHFMNSSMVINDSLSLKVAKLNFVDMEMGFIVAFVVQFGLKTALYTL